MYEEILFNKIINKLGDIFSGNRVLYFLLSLTWGLPMTIIGWVVTILLLPFGKLRRWNHIYYIELRKELNFGLSLGMMFIVGKKASIHMLNHEFGHTVHNAMFGPLSILLVYIPSAFRYWYRVIIRKIKPDISLRPYDDAWFEGTATYIGTHYRLKYGYRYPIVDHYPNRGGKKS